ncbi:ABC transporter ATP-binding protein [Aquipuribacter nitratireducens]|uniref:ABC transporter ATP-binding protein n=1 Tax=Aquipuribacter nitratireducens TaxID=650104 RepID=A0ABW0GKX6_9MICO
MPDAAADPPVAPVPPVVDLDGVGVVRSGSHLLRDVDWTVGDGERWVVLGPNGAGKTTLFDILSARSYPSSGRATILGETLGEVDVFELRPRIGLSSASLAATVPDRERVRDVVLTAAHGVVGRFREPYEQVDADRADALLDAFGVSGLGDRTFGTLSEGERKRVLVARAVMTDPELLLLDEPAAGLDLRGREDLVTGLAHLAASHSAPTTVLVTHHVEEIPPGFDHVLLLRGGEVVAAGPIELVLTAAALSDTFGLPLEVSVDDGRWSARAAR